MLIKSKKQRIALGIALASVCVVFPVLLIPLLIILYVSLGGHGPGFVTAAYGIPSLRKPASEEYLPRSNSDQDDADIADFLAKRQDARRHYLEQASLSPYEESQWETIKTQLSQ